MAKGLSPITDQQGSHLDPLKVKEAISSRFTVEAEVRHTAELQQMQIEANFDVMETLMICGPIIAINPEGGKLLRELQEAVSNEYLCLNGCPRGGVRSMTETEPLVMGFR